MADSKWPPNIVVKATKLLQQTLLLMLHSLFSLKKVLFSYASCYYFCCAIELKISALINCKLRCILAETKWQATEYIKQCLLKFIFCSLNYDILWPF